MGRLGEMTMGRMREMSPTVTFLFLTLLFCSIPYGLIAYTGEVAGGNMGYVVALMWGPALASLVTVRWKHMDWASLGFAWCDSRVAWMGYLLPIAYAGIAYIFIWLTGMGGFADPSSIAPLAEQLGWTITDPEIFVPLYILLVGTTGMVAQTAYALGEELGWRGFLTSRLTARLGFTRAALVIGVIWSLWHVPLILYSNYNNGTPMVYTLVCFFILAMNVTVIMTWLRLKSGSVWPCAILHGSHNLFIQAVYTPLTSSRGTVTPYAIDEFGFAIPIVTFLFALFFWLKRDDAVAAANQRMQLLN